MSRTRTSRATRIRYIGFDMDECVGHVHPLHPFTNEFMTREKEDRKTVHRAAASLAACERARRTGFLRPCIPAVMCAVYDAVKSGQIRSAFLFSNNSNHSLVEFVGLLLETVVQQERGLAERPRLFEMAVSFQSPERGEPTGIKDWASITKSLAYHGLPLPTTKSDLLFFDDKTHALTPEIKHYTVVPAYHSSATLADALRCGLGQGQGRGNNSNRWNKLPKWQGGTAHRVPVEDEGRSAFLDSIQRFLEESRTHGKSRTHRRTRKNRRHV
jgi:hypothetical protein